LSAVMDLLLIQLILAFIFGEVPATPLSFKAIQFISFQNALKYSKALHTNLFFYSITLSGPLLLSRVNINFHQSLL